MCSKIGKKELPNAVAEFWNFRNFLLFSIWINTFSSWSSSFAAFNSFFSSWNSFKTSYLKENHMLLLIIKKIFFEKLKLFKFQVTWACSLTRSFSFRRILFLPSRSAISLSSSENFSSRPLTSAIFSSRRFLGNFIKHQTRNVYWVYSFLIPREPISSGVTFILTWMK